MIESSPSSSAAAPAASSRPVEREFQSLHCRNCRRLMLKHTDDAVKAGAMIEIKCRHCNAMNYLMGRVVS